VSVPSLDFGINDFTVKTLVSAFGGFLGACSVAFERKSTVPFLSFAGLSLGTIGFLLPFGFDQAVVSEYSVNIPWIGSLITLVGVLLMFLGFALRNAHVPKWALAVIPVLLGIYLISPVLIFTRNLQFFLFLQVNISMSTLMGLLILLGHLVIVWAGITGLRIPEKEHAVSPSKINATLE
jgi:hypothetical protein